MAIDTLQKRQSATGPRGALPWFRRFHSPLPDGTIGAADRQQLPGWYAGIAASTPPVVSDVYASDFKAVACTSPTIRREEFAELN